MLLVASCRTYLLVQKHLMLMAVKIEGNRTAVLTGCWHIGTTLVQPMRLRRCELLGDMQQKFAILQH
jgi:hypothetical protein